MTSDRSADPSEWGDDRRDMAVLLTDHSPAELAREVLRLREDAAQAYQAVGLLADKLGYWEMAAEDPRQVQVTKLLDNLAAAGEGEPRPHTDLLPFGWKT